MEVCNTDCLCYSVSDKQYLVASSFISPVYSHTSVTLFRFCIHMYSTETGISRHGTQKHWKVHPFIVLFKLSLIQNHLRNVNVPSLTAPDFFPFLVVYTEFQ